MYNFDAVFLNPYDLLVAGWRKNPNKLEILRNRYKPPKLSIELPQNTKHQTPNTSVFSWLQMSNQ